MAEHNAEVLGTAGFTVDEIAGITETGVIAARKRIDRFTPSPNLTRPMRLFMRWPPYEGAGSLSCTWLPSLAIRCGVS